MRLRCLWKSFLLRVGTPAWTQGAGTHLLVTPPASAIFLYFKLLYEAEPPEE
jgi:hypothetical protein